MLFEVPSNLVMDKVGARLWLARIMITWGLISAATAAVVGPTSFLLVRFLLGAGEAGLFPGTILLFTYWFPDAHRGRIIGLFTLALPVSVALGAPISTAILGMDGMLGVKGWQWIYILEAVPTVIVGIFVLVAMNDRPATAKWLTEPERDWLTSTLQSERRAVEAGGKFSILQSMTNPKVLLLSVNYLGIVTASLGLLLFVPQIIKSLGASTMNTGYATSLAYVCGAVSMILFGWLSDRLGDRRWLLFTTCMMATAGLVIAGATMGTWWSLVGHVPRHGRVLRHQRSVLGDADHDPDRRRGGERDRLHQRLRQYRRRGGAGDRGLAEGRDRQLRGRAVWPGRVHRRQRPDRRRRPAHPTPHRRGSGGAGGVAGFIPQPPVANRDHLR